MPGLEHSFGFHTSPSAYGLMSDGVASEQVKKFFFTSGKTSTNTTDNDEEEDTLEIYIPEVSRELLVLSTPFQTEQTAALFKLCLLLVLRKI